MPVLKITPEVIDRWIDQQTHYVGGDLESLHARAEATQKVLLAVLRTLSPAQLLAVLDEVGSTESVLVPDVGYVDYTADDAEVLP